MASHSGLSSSGMWRPAQPRDIVGITGSTVTNNSATNYVDFPNVSLPVVSGTLYRLRVEMAFQTDATTTGIVLQIASPPAMTFSAFTARCMQTGVAGNAEFSGPLTVGNGYTITFSGVAAVNTDYFAEIVGLFQPSADATMVIKFRSEVESSVVTVKAGAVAILGRPVAASA